MDQGKPPSRFAALTARIMADDLLPARRSARPPEPNRTGITVVASTHRKRSTAHHVIARGWYPSGEAHAVPDGSAIALCGWAPRYIWNGPFQPDLRGLSVCRSCAAAFRTA